MKKAFQSIRCTLFIVSCIALLTGTAYSATVRWHGYNDGMALAKEQKKKVFLYFWADWCSYCEKMEKDTLSKKAVARILNTDFISIKVNSEADQQLASQYFVRGLPTTWFLTESGAKISNLPGYVAPDLFVPILRYIHSNSYQTMKFKEFLDNK
jgi:thioredoxin-related protein